MAAGPDSGQSRVRADLHAHADVIVRMGTEGDVETCNRLVAAMRSGEAASWWQTLTRTARDRQRRAPVRGRGLPPDCRQWRVECAKPSRASSPATMQIAHTATKAGAMAILVTNADLSARPGVVRGWRARRVRVHLVHGHLMSIPEAVGR